MGCALHAHNAYAHNRVGINHVIALLHGDVERGFHAALKRFGQLA